MHVCVRFYRRAINAYEQPVFCMYAAILDVVTWCAWLDLKMALFSGCRCTVCFLAVVEFFAVILRMVDLDVLFQRKIHALYTF